MDENKQILSYSIQKEKDSVLKYTKSNESFKIPEIINSNLKHSLRFYQNEAMENFIFLNNPLNFDIIKELLNEYKSKNNHHLFHMATGSGKTMMMAATIIYLHSFGYKRFIFTTNQTNLISKTKYNLLPNLRSSKCEFKDKYIESNGQKISIREVKNFSKHSNDVEIIFTTIHTLHNQINENKENSINLNDINDLNIVILADEAHHFQTATKTQKDEENTWEDTIQKILNINHKNKLIEYTATMDLSKKTVLDKYFNKIIYDYTLKKFRDDGYSKEISLIQNSNKEERILQSILINQFRYEIALQNNISVLPKILFKSSGTILDLEKEKNYILSLISNLSIEQLNTILINSNLSYLNKLNLYLSTDKEKENFISLIKKQFNDNSSLIIHSKDNHKEEKLKIANNLDKNESVRMIFAIDMLNEGWDVLSLFDIVKIDEIAKNTVKKSTTSEVQLIGRGARIFPYATKNEFNEELDRFKRKFDNNTNNPLRLLEDMNFYSANDNDYINNIKKELIALGLKDQDEVERKLIKVKPRNELSNFAKTLLNKFIFTNQLEKKYKEDALISDFDVNINIVKDFKIREENLIDVQYQDDNSYEQTMNITTFVTEHGNMFILNNVLNEISYFNMNNIIKNYRIKTRQELIVDILDLDNKVSITIKNKNMEDLSFNDKKIIVKEILFELVSQVERKRNIRIGSKNFRNGFKISNTFQEYSKNENNVKGYDEDLSYVTTANTKCKKNFKIKNKKLFYYDNLSWDSGLELELYHLFDKHLDDKNYLVIRNEVSFKMYNPFTEFKENEKYSILDQDIFSLNGDGFEPDFIVLRKGSHDNEIYQYFIEVKGEDKVDTKKNKWKEVLLNEINNEEQIIEDNVTYRLFGLPFFTEEDNKNEISGQNYIKKIKGE